ncbi:MAG: peroxiredoxin family protein [Myxococcota bacterium]
MLALLVSLASAQTVPGPSLHVGDDALLFSLPALNEDAAMRAVSKPHVALADFTGGIVTPPFPAQAVVVHFLRREGGDGQLATLERLHKKYQNRGLRIVAIVAQGGDLAPLSDWISSQRLNFPVLNDQHGIVSSRYGVAHFPMTFIVDGEGSLAAIGAPSEGSLEAQLETVVQPLLK